LVQVSWFVSDRRHDLSLLAMVALAFPDHPEAPTWAAWAFSELDHLWGPMGHYVTGKTLGNQGPSRSHDIR
jgi:hypothetical protein